MRSYLKESCDGFRCSGRARSRYTFVFAEGRAINLCKRDAQELQRIIGQDLVT